VAFAQGIFFGRKAGRLGSYNVDERTITVSGISSGSMMATQFHFAHSSEISGSGVFAGGPYLCGLGGLSAATCMLLPNTVSTLWLIAQANTLAGLGQIDRTSNIRGDQVYIFAGTEDTVVKQAGGIKLEAMYRNYGANITTKYDIGAEHGQPTDNIGGRCDTLSPQTGFIINCNYQGAYEMFNAVLGGGLIRPNSSETIPLGELLEFDQSEFVIGSIPALTSFDTTGYVYVPRACADKTTKCRLHIAYHGCLAYRLLVGDAYATKTGYIEAAELNNIIVIFPQLISLPHNPMGCWDWFGYLGQLFPTKIGDQILTTHRMMKRVQGLY